MTQNEFFTKGETEAVVVSITDVVEKLRRGEVNRQYAKTHMNHKSSRSHTIFRLKVKSISAQEAVEKISESVVVGPTDPRTSSISLEARNWLCTRVLAALLPRLIRSRERERPARTASRRRSTSTRVSSS